MKNYNFDYDFNGSPIHQRQSDGYVNLTEMVKAGDPSKLLADYLRLETTKRRQAEVASDMGIPISKVFDVKKGGNSKTQGTWGHPLMAIDCAMWVSAPMWLWSVKTIRLVIDGEFTPNTEDARKAQEEVRRLWAEVRQWSIDSFWFMGDEMKAWLESHRSEMSENEVKFYWSNAQDRINLALFGKRAWQIRQELGVNKSCQIREMYGKVALKNIEMVQRLAAAHISGRGMSPTEAIDAALATWNINIGNYQD